MPRAEPHILALNGGSSSIKFALFEVRDPRRRVLAGEIARIGLPDAALRVQGMTPADNFSQTVAAPDHAAAAAVGVGWIDQRAGPAGLIAAGHRLVHGGPKYVAPQRIAAELVEGMRDLLDRAADDVRPAEAIALFCYQVKKWIGGVAAALCGLDTLVFAGGFGTDAPVIRARICDGLGFLGRALDGQRNAANDGVISAAASPVTVRVTRTDEERMIAAMICTVLDLRKRKEIQP